MTRDLTFVVEKDTGNRGRTKVVYAGTDADRAKETCDQEYEEKMGKRLHTFIQVWDGGELLFTTREHPFETDRLEREDPAEELRVEETTLPTIAEMEESDDFEAVTESVRESVFSDREETSIRDDNEAYYCVPEDSGSTVPCPVCEYPFVGGDEYGWIDDGFVGGMSGGNSYYDCPTEDCDGRMIVLW